MKKRRNKKRFHHYLLIILIIAAMAVSFLISYGKNLNIPNWQKVYKDAHVYAPVGDGISVSYIDVGQGDSIFLNADGYSVLIDAGVRKNAEEIITFLERYNIEKLDLVVATHPDADHIGGMSEIVQTYDIGAFVTSHIKDKYQSATKTYSTLIQNLEDNNIDITYASADDTYTYGAMTVNVLSPDHEYKNTNDDSVVVKVKYGNSKFLFTGDASSSVENHLISKGVDLSADVLKVSHHGSRTGTSLDFLEAVNPEISVVSVSDHNSYNLPNVEVMNRLYEYGGDVYRTDDSGTITVSSDGENITVDTEK